MKSQISKVAHPIIDRPILAYVLRAAASAAAEIGVVVGARSESVLPIVGQYAADAFTVFQEQRLGTGHAAQLALAELSSREISDVLILAGDTPLIQGQTLQDLASAHKASGAACTILSANLSDPTGYGRIIRSDSGAVSAIVEQRDASEAQRQIREINSGVYIFNFAKLSSHIGSLQAGNAQGELYLTDVIALLVQAGDLVSAHVLPDQNEVLGVNDRVQLAECAGLMRDRINTNHQRAGVTIEDPATTWIGIDAQLAPDVVIKPGSTLSGACEIEGGAIIGPRTTLTSCQIGAGAKVIESTLSEAVIGAGGQVGPYTYIRPGTILGPRAKAGAYVELKAATIGADSKVPHLSYVGDAEIGEGSNIGAATIFVNYDGVHKHRTIVGNHVRVGSDSMLVAPVRIGDGAYTAAGSVITEDVPAGAIAVARAKQRNILGWVLRKRSGTSSAAAALAAGAEAVDLAPSNSEQTSGEGK